MRNLLQRTLRKSISVTGVGLHSGEKITMTLRPAAEDTGIVFHRIDCPGSSGIRACLENVIHTHLATSIGQDGLMVGTVEHLTASLAGLGVDNVRVDLTGPEVPIMDGSAGPFVYLLKSVGVKVQSKFKKFIVVKEPISVSEDDRMASVAPSRELIIDYSISYDHNLVRNQRMQFNFSDLAFDRELSRARTFGFLHEVEYLKKNGFARGGSLANAVVIDRFRILNQDGLRFPDEFIRHKILDFIGDISLMGAPIIGKFTAVKSGHTLNHSLLTKLKACPESWTLVEFSHPSHYRQESLQLPTWGLLDAPTRQAA